MDYCNYIKDYIQKETEVLHKLDFEAINSAINLLEETRKKQAIVYIFGNGGSASTASHFQGDFNKGVSEGLSQKYRFCCLSDNTATVMALANDCGYENIFAIQLENRLNPNDIVIAISGSGNSANVVKAVKYAKACGNKVIGLTGYDGGELKVLSDISLHVPVNDMQIAEDLHLMFDHLMMSVLCRTTEEKRQ